jgi:DNA-binding CsgD family transcriptional regulator
MEQRFQWTEDAVKQLIALHGAGRSATEIDRALGCGSRCAVLGKLHRLRDQGKLDGARTFQKRADYKPGAGRNRQSPGLVHIPLITVRAAQGLSDRQIADEIGIKPDDVRYARKVGGISANDYVPPPPPYADDVAKLVNQGKSDRSVADALGITLWQARGERRRQGLKSQAEPTPRVTNIVKGDPGEKVMKVFAEGFLGQRSRLSLVQLPLSNACRFPIDQVDGSVRYCGDVTSDGCVYCTHHAARCYVAVEPKKALRPSHVYGPRR